MTLPDILAPLAADDWSGRILSAVLPAGGDTTPVSMALSVIASGLTLLAVAWLGYGLVSQVVGAARTGRPVSESQSGAWAILRPVVGLAMLVPVGAFGGLSGVHMVLREVAVASANLGNAAAVGAVELAAIGGRSALPSSSGGRELVSAIAASEVCAAVYERAAETLGGRHDAAGSPPEAGAAVVSPAVTSWWTGEVTMPARTSGFVWSWGPACGSVSMSSPAEFGEFGERRRALVAGLVREVRATGAEDRLAKLAGSVVDGEDRGETSGQGLVRAWEDSGALTKGLVGKLYGLGDAYDRAVARLAESTVRTDDSALRQRLVEHVESCGWPCVGSSYRVIAGLSAAATGAASERAARVSPDPAAWGSAAPSVRRAMALLESQRLVGAEDAARRSGDLSDSSDDADSVFRRMTESITRPMRDYLTGYDGWDSDPVGTLMSTGSVMLVSAEVAFGIGAAATAAANFWSSSLGAALDFLMKAGWPAITAAWASGAMLTYVLPIIPWIFVTFAFAGWALEVLVGSVAVLAWAFGHARLDGAAFVDRAQAHGYGSLVVSVLLRPSATVAAYLAADAMCVVILNFMRYSFDAASSGATNGQTLGITGVIIYAIMAIFLQFSIFMFFFKSILSIPERVGAWLGVQVASWSEGHAAAAAVGVVTAGAASAARSSGGGLARSRGPRGPSGGASGGTPGASRVG